MATEKDQAENGIIGALDSLSDKRGARKAELRSQVQDAAPAIRRAREKAYSWAEIADVFKAKGVKISEHTLRKYMRTAAADQQISTLETKLLEPVSRGDSGKNKIGIFEQLRARNVRQNIKGDDRDV